MTFDAISRIGDADELSITVAALFEEYAKQTCAYLYSMVGNWELANDLNQDLYLQLFRSRNRGRTGQV